MKEKRAPWIEATEAIKLLDGNRATLYAYVSRGHIRSEPLAGGTRRRRYSREDIDQFVARIRERRNPENAAEQALHLGMPVLESGITLVANSRVYYRGHDLTVLASTRSIADVTALLWGGTGESQALQPLPRQSLAMPGRKQAIPFIAAAQIALALPRWTTPLRTTCGRTPSRRPVGASPGNSRRLSLVGCEGRCRIVESRPQ